MKNQCSNCGKLCQGERCQKCYLLYFNPAKNPIIVKKMSHRKEKHPAWKGGLPKCIECDKELSRRDAKRCRKCSNLNIFYIDGRSFLEYSSAFNFKLKYEIRERDNFECQNCGMTEEEHLSVYGKVLEIHHIDYDRQNCNKDNLITLCKQSNNRANYNREYWQKFYKSKMEVIYCE